jgi:hypothetical protein
MHDHGGPPGDTPTPEQREAAAQQLRGAQQQAHEEQKSVPQRKGKKGKKDRKKANKG